jgi:hypothetical protein
VELVLSDNAPGLVDVLDTDEPTVPTYNLTACLEALELILTLSANGAFSAEIEDKLADVVDDVCLFSATLSSKLRSRSSSLPPRPTLVIYTFDLYPEVSQPHFDNEAHA